MEISKNGISHGFEHQLVPFNLFFRHLTLNFQIVMLTFLLLLLVCFSATFAQAQMTTFKRIQIKHISVEVAIDALSNDIWDKASEVVIRKYWSGIEAPEGRHFKTRLMWSDTALYVRFDANADEPLVVSDTPDLTTKAIGLWDRDVCEIFIAPDRSFRNKYYEFEIAPTGEWIDLGINVIPKKRITDLEFKSDMTSAVSVQKKKVVMAIKIPFKSLGHVPKIGDVWLGNLFRCVGKDPTRGYLSWQATNTKKPNFHVPSKFGEFEFVK